MNTQSNEVSELMALDQTDHPAVNSSFVTDNSVAAIKAVWGDKLAVAHVTVNDETLTVLADKIDEAILYLAGFPTPGMRVEASILYAAMTTEEFESQPDWK